MCKFDSFPPVALVDHQTPIRIRGPGAGRREMLREPVGVDRRFMSASGNGSRLIRNVMGCFTKRNLWEMAFEVGTLKIERRVGIRHKETNWLVVLWCDTLCIRLLLFRREILPLLTPSPPSSSNSCQGDTLSTSPDWSEEDNVQYLLLL
jgi:hypothetical protein